MRLQRTHFIYSSINLINLFLHLYNHLFIYSFFLPINCLLVIVTLGDNHIRTCLLYYSRAMKLFFFNFQLFFKIRKDIGQFLLHNNYEVPERCNGRGCQTISFLCWESKFRLDWSLIQYCQVPLAVIGFETIKISSSSFILKKLLFSTLC